MPSALENAKRRFAELKKELEEIQTFIALYERYSGLSTELSTGTYSAEVSPDTQKYGVTNKRIRNAGLTPKGIVELAERVIRESGRPLTRGDLVAMFAARDVELPGDDKARYIGTIMWRHKSKFINIEGRGYWLRGQPVPPPMPQIVPYPESPFDPDDPAVAALF